MENTTVINPAVQSSSATVTNTEVVEEYNRQNNIETDSSSSITEGTTICDKYKVQSQLEVSSGEADLFLCSDGSRQYVAKVYKRKFAIKQEVIDALLKIDSPYVARLYETGTYNGYPVEILPYYERGSLQGKTFTEDELVRKIIPNINEGLHAIHKAGIIHKDLKPSNIMLNSDGETVSIIDFGISSIIADGNTVLVTKTGMTPEYSAPETFKNLFLRESDYYSFGITLFELFCGYAPYANMQPEGIGNVGKGTMPVFKFLGEDFTDPALLVTAFAKNWEEGKKQLFRGVVTAHFRTWNQEIARKCQAAEEEAGRENGKDDIIFWKLLYQINPKLKGFYWMGQTYESLPAFGRDVLEKLWDKDKSQYSYYSSILSEKLLSQYVLMAAPKNEKLKKAAEAIEDSYELEKNNGTDMQRTYYLMAYTLSGQKLLLLDGEQIRTVGELANYMRTVLAESFDKFESLCHRLVDYDGNLDFQLETWLMAIGKQKEIEKWRASMNE